jgi:probable phosphoglycerate mutase
VVDHPLTQLGREQARAAARWFASRAVDGVYTSPLRRARETAAAVSMATGAALVELDGLREVDVGELDGRFDEPAWELYHQTVAAWREGRPRTRFPGGESLEEGVLRMAGVLCHVLPRHPEQDLVLVGHGEIFSSALSLLLRLGRTPGMPPASVTVVRRDETGLICESWASTGHLASVL